MKKYPLPALACLCLLVFAFSSSLAASNDSAWGLLWTNDYQGASASFSRILAADKDNQDARRGLLMAQLALGNETGVLETLKDYTPKAPHSQYDYLLLGWLEHNTDMEGKQFRKLMYEFARQLAKDKQLDPVSKRWIVSKELNYLQELGVKDEILKCAQPLNRISDWTLLGPFDNTSDSGHRKDHVANFNFEPQTKYTGKFGQPIHWFHPRVYSLDGTFAPQQYFFRKKFTTAYAQTRVGVKEAGTYMLSVGYSGDVDLYLDGELFRQCPRESSADESLHWLVDLPAGWTQIGVKISNREDASVFSCALSQVDGSPTQGLVVDAAGNGFNPAPDLNVRPVPNPLLQKIAATAAAAPDDPQAFFWNILRVRLEEVPDTVEEFCTQDLVAHADCGLIRLAAFEIMDRRGDSRSALARDMLKVAPGLAEASIIKARMELDKDRNPEAREALKGVSAPDGSCLTATMLKIMSLEGSELWADAKSEAVKAAREFPDEPGPYQALVRYDDKMGAMGDKNDHRKKAMARLTPFKRLSLEFRMHFEKENFGNARGDITELRDLFPASDVLWYYTVLAMAWDSDNENALRQNIWSLESFPQSLSLLTNLADFAQSKYTLKSQLYETMFKPDLAQAIGAILKRRDPGEVEALRKLLKKGATRILQRALDVDPGNFEIRDKISALLDMPPISKTLPDPKVEDIVKLRVDPKDYPGDDSVVLFSSSRRLVFDRRASLLDNVMAVQILSEDGIKQWENIDLGDNPFRDLKVLAKEIIKKDGPQSTGKKFLNKIMFPGLTTGDVILVHYRTNSYVSGNLAGNFWDQHVFSFRSSPCVTSTYELILPDGLVPQTHLWNAGTYLAEGYPRNEAMDGKRVKTVWRFENLPAATREPLAPSSLQTMPWLDISTIHSWRDIAGWYLDIAGGQTDADTDVQAKGKELTADCQTESEAVAHIFDFVANDIRYESVPFFQSGYVPRAAGDVLADGYGDCKDKACLMISLLNTAGYQGYSFALVTPGAPADCTFLPSPRFNHVIVFKLDQDKTVHWYDPTYAKSEPEQIPRYLAGVPSLIADPRVSELVNITTADFREYPYLVDATAVLDDRGDGVITQTETLNQVDHIAWLRSELSGMTDKELKARQNTAEAIEYPGAEVLEVSVEGLEPGTTPVVMKTKYKVPELGEMDDGILSIKLPWSSQLVDRYSAVVAQQVRELPIDLWSMDLCEKEILQIQLPAGRLLASVPEGKDLVWRACHYTTHYVKNRGGITATRELAIAGAKVSTTDYPDFKSWLDEVRRDLNRTHHMRTN